MAKLVCVLAWLQVMSPNCTTNHCSFTTAHFHCRKRCACLIQECFDEIANMIKFARSQLLNTFFFLVFFVTKWKHAKALSLHSLTNISSRGKIPVILDCELKYPIVLENHRLLIFFPSHFIRARERVVNPLCGSSFCKCPQWPEFCQAKARILKLDLGLLCGNQIPKPWRTTHT